ncbi:MAG: mucoidy inhibitor MuiA family protein [Coleofasciculaceae cyanobacterium]
MNKTVDTHIQEVKVYADRALVKRRGVVQLTGEENELIVAQLPTTLVSESVRATGIGVAVRLLGVRTERIYTTEAIAHQVLELHRSIAKIEDEKRLTVDQLTLLNLQRNFIKALNTQYLERLGKISNPEQLNLEEIKKLLDFVGQQYSDFSKGIVEQEKQQQKLDKQLQTLRQQLQQVSTPQPQESFNIIVSLEASEAGEFELELSYMVQEASWKPLYDLRFSITSQNIDISYLAEVQQSTGEDWLDVDLTLSTAKPGLGSLPPKLTPWYVELQQQKDLSTSRIRRKGEAYSSQDTIRMPFAGTAPEFDEDFLLSYSNAEIATAEVSKQGGVVTFGISGGGNIPSDGTPHQTTIFNDDYPYRAEYIAMPHLVGMAYLQTTITNPLTGVTLLPGKVNIFRDNTFVGTTELENIAPGQEFKLNLGIDETLKIERDLVERQVDKKLIGNYRRTTYAYRLVVTNLSDQANNISQLTLTEQLPVSRNEQIKIRLTRSNPQIQISDLGLLEWLLALEPNSAQEIYYQFTVEQPPDLTILGLDI